MNGGHNPMKCIKNVKGEIRRVSDRQAATHVRTNEWEYIPKSEWKEARKKKDEIKKTEAKKSVKKVNH